jgi:transporter family protein
MNYTWLLFALLSAATASLVAIFGKLGLKGIDTNTATALRAIIMAIFLFLVVLFQGKLGLISEIVSNKKALTYIVFSGIAGALSWLFYFVALKFGNVQQVAPIDRLSVVFAVILAAIFLGEKISITSGIGASLIVVGAICITLG